MTKLTPTEMKQFNIVRETMEEPEQMEQPEEITPATITDGQTDNLPPIQPLTEQATQQTTQTLDLDSSSPYYTPEEFLAILNTLE